MANEKSFMERRLLKVNLNAGFDDLMKAWPKETLYRKDEPPLSPESLAIVEKEYKKAFSRGCGLRHAQKTLKTEN